MKEDKRNGKKKRKKEQIKNTKGKMRSMCTPIFTVTHWLMYKEYMSYHLENKRVRYVLGKMFVRKFPTVLIANIFKTEHYLSSLRCSLKQVPHVELTVSCYKRGLGRSILILPLKFLLGKLW